MTVAPAPAGLDFPHAQQVAVIERRTVHRRSGRVTTDIEYAITSQTPEQADAARINQQIREHWQIETLHRHRDVTLGEDASRVRTGAAPQVMATIRNLTLGILLRRDPPRLVTLMRHLGRNPARTLQLLTT